MATVHSCFTASIVPIHLLHNKTAKASSCNSSVDVLLSKCYIWGSTPSFSGSLHWTFHPLQFKLPPVRGTTYMHHVFQPRAFYYLTQVQFLSLYYSFLAHLVIQFSYIDNHLPVVIAFMVTTHDCLILTPHEGSPHNVLHSSSRHRIGNGAIWSCICSCKHSTLCGIL